jgi:hypothetical protein
VPLLGGGHAFIDVRQLRASFELSDGVVERGAVDLSLQIVEIALATCIIGLAVPHRRWRASITFAVSGVGPRVLNGSQSARVLLACHRSLPSLPGQE